MFPLLLSAIRVFHMSAAVLPRAPRDPHGIPLTIQYKIAATRSEREAAFRLVHSSYLRAGLSHANPYGMRVTPYHLLDSTDVLLACYQGETILTMTLVGDGRLGLPMESIYREELAARRALDRALAEVSCLADRRLSLREFCPVFIGLSQLCAQYARHQGYDDLVIAVHPKHARFYRRLFGFESLGPLRTYPTVRNRPAVALYLDLVALRERHPQAYQTLFGVRVPVAAMIPQPMPPEEREYFGAMIDPNFHAVPLGPDEEAALVANAVFGQETILPDGAMEVWA